MLDVGHTEQAPGAISAREVTELGINRRLAAVAAERWPKMALHRQPRRGTVLASEGRRSFVAEALSDAIATFCDRP